ncbi:hypothetical protein [Bradyrhizobium sp. LMG 9283]
MLPAWIGIPGVILLIALIAYGFRQGSKVTTSRRAIHPSATRRNVPS